MANKTTTQKKSTQHTPGPWEARRSGDHWNIGDTNGNTSFAVVRDHFGNAAEDARLIAASPTMYAYIQKRAEAGDSEAVKILAGINA